MQMAFLSFFFFCFFVQSMNEHHLLLNQGKKQPRITNDQHSFLLCIFFLRQHGGPSERFLLTPVAGGWDGCQYLQQHWHVFPFRTAWLKATCYTLSLTHTQLQNTHQKSNLWHRGCSKSSDHHPVWAAVKPDKSSNPPWTNSAVSLITVTLNSVKMHFLHRTKTIN